MKRSGKVLIRGKYAGIVWQEDNKYGFEYNKDYRKLKDAVPVSLTLPLRDDPFLSNSLHPFFDGLIPEGWLLDITVKNWKVNPNDRMELLLLACKDCLGAVSIEPIDKEEE